MGAGGGGLGERRGLPGPLGPLRHAWASMGSLHSWTSCSKGCVHSAFFWENEGREEASSKKGPRGRCFTRLACCAVFLYGVSPKKGCFSDRGPQRRQRPLPQNRAFCPPPTAGGVRPCVRCRAARGDPRLWDGGSQRSRVPLRQSARQGSWCCCLAGAEESGGSARSAEQVRRPRFLSPPGGQCPPTATGGKEGDPE